MTREEWDAAVKVKIKCSLQYANKYLQFLYVCLFGSKFENKNNSTSTICHNSLTQTLSTVRQYSEQATL